jgi:hypothetical protein
MVSKRHSYAREAAVFGTALLCSVISANFPASAETDTESATEQAGVTQYQVETGQVQPISGAALQSAAAPLSNAQMEALLQERFKLRAAAGVRVDSAPSPKGLPLVAGPETTVAPAGQFPPNPQLFVIGRNNKVVNGFSQSTLAEPAAANDALRVFAAGNFAHAEVSTNGGASWTNVPLPGGPSDAPINCCDHDVVIDDARRVTFHADLYTNAAQSQGVVRIFVLRTAPTAACFFDIRSNVTSGTALTDFPKLGLTKRFLYLTINALGAGGGFARIIRFNIDQLSDCVSTSFSTFTQSFNIFGQRVWRPAEGTNNIEAAYWGQSDNATTFRVFRWRESDAGPTSVTRTVTASSFRQPDCRGGVGDFNWIDALSAAGVGFSTVGAAAPGALGGPGFVVFYWTVGADAVHTQGHIHAAAFSLTDFSLLAQPHIFNNGVCFGKPNVTANKRGDLGISLGFGGKAGGGGAAAQGAVGIADEFTGGIGFFQQLFGTAAGTHNRSDERYGDYFTIHPYEPCEKWFSATNYALLNGVSAANVNERYVEFGRQQSLRCYQAHRNQLPQD